MTVISGKRKKRENAADFEQSKLAEEAEAAKVETSTSRYVTLHGLMARSLTCKPFELPDTVEAAAIAHPAR